MDVALRLAIEADIPDLAHLFIFAADGIVDAPSFPAYRRRKSSNGASARLDQLSRTNTVGSRNWVRARLVWSMPSRSTDWRKRRPTRD
jgi:hypothetical protein